MVFGTRSGDDPLLQILLEWRDHGRSAGAGYRRADQGCNQGRARCICGPSSSCRAIAETDSPCRCTAVPLPPIGKDHRIVGDRRHTWGIFKRRFWGESLRRRQRLIYLVRRPFVIAFADGMPVVHSSQQPLALSAAFCFAARDWVI